MARTGSGKTLAYLIPLLQRLDGKDSAGHGARALVLCPSRELALQIFRAGKDLGRREGQTTKEEKKANLNWALIIGGETMDKQFEALTNKPDM